ncbi:MAG: DUF4389 domain-containing protein [Dehalococcoidia bacterium]
MQDPNAYPVRFWVDRPDSLNRLLNFPFLIGTIIKIILCLPFVIFLAILLPKAGGQYGEGTGVEVPDAVGYVGLAITVLWLIGPMVILFTGNYPRGLWDFLVGVQRVQARTGAYIASQTDRYPPFSLGSDTDHSAHFEIDRPESLSRLLNFPIVGQVIKAILCIPHFIVLIVVGIISILFLILGQFAILLTGNFPGGMWGFNVGVAQWGYRVFAYIWSFTDRYPPFSLDTSHSPEK